ncbi:hypothetical protein MASR1M31_22280 [Porphyromonadaceae bacterium]
MKSFFNKMIVIFALSIMVLASCRILEDGTGDTYNTNIAELILPIDYHKDEPYPNASLYWLYDEIVLIVRDIAAGCAYDIYDWNEEKILKTGELTFKTNLPHDFNQVSFTQLNESLFLVNKIHDQTEAYIWQYKEGEVVVRPLSLVESLSSYVINANATCMLGISDSLDSVQIYKIKDGDELEFIKEGSLSKDDLALPVDSKLLQAAFINDDEFVYYWSSDKGEGGYGVYSLEQQTKKNTGKFDNGILLSKKDSVILERRNYENEDGFIFFHSNGTSGTIEDEKTDGIRILFSKNIMVSGDYIAYRSKVMKNPSEAIVTWKVMKPLDSKSAVVWNIGEPRSRRDLVYGTAAALALSKDQIPQLLFFGEGWSAGLKEGYPKDCYVLYIVTLKS